MKTDQSMICIIICCIALGGSGCGNETNKGLKAIYPLKIIEKTDRFEVVCTEMLTIDDVNIQTMAHENQIVIECKVTNTSENAIVLYHPNPSYVFVFLDGTVYVVFAWMPIPEDTYVYVFERPGYLKIDSKKTIKLTTNLDRPVLNRTPYYYYDLDSPPKQMTSSSLQIVLGYAIEKSIIKYANTCSWGKPVQSAIVEYSAQKFKLSEKHVFREPVVFRHPGMQLFWQTQEEKN